MLRLVQCIQNGMATIQLRAVYSVASRRPCMKVVNVECYCYADTLIKSLLVHAFAYSGDGS